MCHHWIHPRKFDEIAEADPGTRGDSVEEEEASDDVDDVPAVPSRIVVG